MSIVNNVEIMGLESSIIASGYSMKTDTKEAVYNEKRALNLARAGGGEEQFLTGIVVNFDLTFSIKAWVEAERYRFLNFVSSQSTMHRICDFDIDNQCNSYVDERIISVLNDKVEIYNSWRDFEPTEDWYEDNTFDIENKSEFVQHVRDLYLSVLYNIPTGFKLTARMTTNYRCLQNIYKQRKNHTLPEWREFCKWIETLPMSELITGGVCNERMGAKTRD